MTMSPIATWLNTFFYGFDRAVLSALHKLYDVAPGFFTPFAEFISFLGLYGIILIALGFFLVFFKKTRLIGTAMLLSLAVGSLATNLWLKPSVARPRLYSDTYVALYGDYLRNLWIMLGQHLEVDYSFPSGHTTAAFASMTAVFLTGNKKISWTAFIFAFLMAFARLYLVIHFPSDVLGGIIAGTLAGILGTFIARKLPGKYYELVFFGKNKNKGEDECSAG